MNRMFPRIDTSIQTSSQTRSSPRRDLEEVEKMMLERQIGGENLDLKPAFAIIHHMSEGEPINPFRFRRTPQNVRPDTEEFRDDTSRMDEILDHLSQAVLKPGSVNTSSFTSVSYPEVDRPITEDDFLLLTEIVRLRVDLAYEATERAALLKDVRRHLAKAHPGSIVNQKP
nr:hypothetical protein [Candidatus Levybacteria bacterium]